MRARSEVQCAIRLRGSLNPSVRFPGIALDAPPFGESPRVLRAASDRKGLLSQPVPALRGLQRRPALLHAALSPSTRLSTGLITRPLPACADPVSGSSCCLISKELPSVASEPPSPLPVPTLLFAPSPVGRYASWVFRLRGFTPPCRVSPRRSCPHCCSGSRPWGSPSFHAAFTPRSPWCLSALRSFPSADGRCARCQISPCCHCVSLHLCGEDLSSSPAVTLLCCTPCDVP